MLHLRIVSPEKIAFEGDVNSVTVPGTLGRFEILEQHAPIISSLNKGTVKYDHAQGSESIDVLGGFVLVKHNEVNICVEV